MRENLFRGLDKHYNVWRFGSLFEYSSGQAAIVTKADRYGRGDFTNEVIPETAGQYTGLDDKNGVMIFDGDVLRDDESIVIVKFVDGGFSVDYRTIGGKWRNYSDLFDYLDDYEGEVVGNIHDNPELVEELFH